MTLRDTDGRECLFLDIFLRLVFYHQLTHGGEGVGEIDAQHILMAVEGDHSHFGGIVGSHNTRHIAVVVYRHLQLSRLMRLDIVAHYAHLGIIGTCNRVFISVEAGIVGILILGRDESFIPLEGELSHLALVITHPAQLSAVSGEDHATVGSKLLFVDPVGDAIDNLIKFSILGHLTLSIVVEQFYQVDIILSHESHHLSVGREDRSLLCSSF